jgi:precorrin-6A synthase
LRKLLVIGLGAGDPELLTVQATRALARVDVFFIPDKGEEKAELRDRRIEICRQFAPRARFVEFASPRRRKDFTDYKANVEDWHASIADEYRRLFATELKDGQTVGLPIWGDPSLYDSTLRILEKLDVGYEVVPGISSIQLLAARHRIPLNRIGEPVVVTPARRLAEPLADTTVVVLDGERSYRKLDGETYDIYWGAYLGTKDEILVAGKLGDVKDEIDAKREAARAAKGWIMDTYLLRRR